MACLFVFDIFNLSDGTTLFACAHKDDFDWPRYFELFEDGLLLTTVLIDGISLNNNYDAGLGWKQTVLSTKDKVDKSILENKTCLCLISK